jgi:hypothetical protein
MEFPGSHAELLSGFIVVCHLAELCGLCSNTVVMCCKFCCVLTVVNGPGFFFVSFTEPVSSIIFGIWLFVQIEYKLRLNNKFINQSFVVVFTYPFIAIQSSGNVYGRNLLVSKQFML